MDADVQKDDCFSIPRHSFIIDDYFPYYRGGRFINTSIDYTSITSTFVFMSCPKPIHSPPNYIVDASSCKNGSNLFNYTSNISSPSSQNYSYVFIPHSYSYSCSYSYSYDHIIYYLSGDIPDLCYVNLMYPTFFTSDPLKNETNIISYKEVHDSIVYGFDLSWSGACCDFLKENHCKLNKTSISRLCGTLHTLSLSLSHTHTHTHTHT